MEADAGVHMEDLDAAELVRGAVEEFRDQANSHRLELEMPAGERRLCADVSPRAALRNLLDNGREYSPILDRESVARIPGKRVAISVQDQGAEYRRRATQGVPEIPSAELVRNPERQRNRHRAWPWWTTSSKRTRRDPSDSAPGRGSRLQSLPAEPRQR